MNRIIQQLRAVAIIAVIVMHSCPSGVAGVLVRSLTNFAVALFLFLSGYLTRFDYSAGNIKRRIVRVLPAYIVFGFIYILKTHYTSTVKGVIFCLATGTGVFHLYYILVYIQFVLITPIIIKIAKSGFWKFGLLITPVFVLIVRYIVPMFNTRTLNSEMLKFFPSWFIFYYLGILIRNGVYKPTMSKKVLYAFLGVSLALQITEGYVWMRMGYYDMAITQVKASSIITSVIVCLIAYILITDNKMKIIPIFVGIGNCSFGIYLIHAFLLNKTIFPINAGLTLVLSFILVWGYRYITSLIKQRIIN